jgi:hypothetical protein
MQFELNLVFSSGQEERVGVEVSGFGMLLTMFGVENPQDVYHVLGGVVIAGNPAIEIRTDKQSSVRQEWRQLVKVADDLFNQYDFNTYDVENVERWERDTAIPEVLFCTIYLQSPPAGLFGHKKPIPLKAKFIANTKTGECSYRFV